MAINESKNSKATRKYVEVEEWVLNYSLKKQPVIAVGKKGRANNELYDARGLAIYDPYQLVYIANLGHCCIQVVTFEGNFVTNFGQDILKDPCGIAVTEDHVFVTDLSHNALFQFCDFKLARAGLKGSAEGKLCRPRGLCKDYNGDVYVADSNNNRVSVFSEELKFLNSLGTQELRFPVDVKVILNSILVLDWNPHCVHFYSRSGHLINSCISQEMHGMVWYPYFFCLDPAGNILITDYYRHDIKILSPSGELIHTIGKKGYRRGELIYPLGICISQLGTIFVLSNKDNVLQIF
ncbi:Outer membrane phospholipase A [Oopsacas minuta]|uniref:Outer membrane phospholipase A n=1 Tax=Oopsacas minuta TaxID=111878 RepID=A0AAV7KD79_9METZ|nr:Outer membrane phospholipase A [Oopsacas minuta]